MKIKHIIQNTLAISWKGSELYTVLTTQEIDKIHVVVTTIRFRLKTDDHNTEDFILSVGNIKMWFRIRHCVWSAV